MNHDLQPCCTDLGHLGQIQGRPLLVCVGWSPPLHANFFVVEDAGLRVAPCQSPLPRMALQLGGGVWGAGRRGPGGFLGEYLFIGEVKSLGLGFQGGWGEGEIGRAHV